MLFFGDFPKRKELNTYFSFRTYRKEVQMELTKIKSVMKKYSEAWENQDIDLILDCFTKNGIYQESPLTKPYREHKKIKKSLKK
ncbi:hypothetical protein CMI44_00605 [Candidatus Pacearchaeota archaeon]|mgnify:CR=1 FL=1|jgi:hypothetical protein|nr:hypothetical protein [Candidatus Pacearchaeota archaeon]|tara:strand:- start:1703 stop:1954 length:252 start_codon:yes stop_codon:yes gene_type:complete